MKKLTTGVLLAGAALLSGTAMSQPTSAAEITLKFANWLPPFHHWTKTARRFADSIEKASGGSLKIAMDKAALAKPPGQYDLAKNGVRDMVMHVAAYTPGRFVLYRMAEVPFATPNAASGSAGLHKWYTKHGFDKQEFQGTKLISAFVHGPGLLHSKKEIKTLADIKGVKIRVGGGGVLMAKRLGAVPVAMSATKAHESLQRGTTDAAFFPWEAVHGFKLSKLVKFHLEVPGGLYTTPFMVAMNKKKYDGLPAKAKRALDTAGGAAGAKLIGEGWDAADKIGKSDAVKAGNKISTISAAEQKTWGKAIQIIKEDWINKANKKGHNGKALMEELLSMMKG
jgi:TRAP-type C4-dicarboxylate transport system substrate-binding protein